MSDAPRVVRVWDAPVRLFHWLAVVLVVTAYVTWRLNWMDWHGRIGEVLLALSLFRLLWGFFGSDTARFSRFLTSPRTAVQHLRYVFVREPDYQIGHNPAGGWMVFLLLLLLLAEALTGLYVARLTTLAEAFDVDGRIAAPAGPRIKPGSRLIREWHGRTHTVCVTDGGFEFEGRTYASLTKIARDITGAQWSGPRFFGLTKTSAPATSGGGTSANESSAETISDCANG